MLVVSTSRHLEGLYSMFGLFSTLSQASAAVNDCSVPTMYLIHLFIN